MLDAALTSDDITHAALAGLTAMPKTLPPKLFYDARGVELFESITKLPEYYLTRTERALLTQIAPELTTALRPGSALVEYGASDEAKALLLLDARPQEFVSYVPIDVAEGALDSLSERLGASHPELRVDPVCADFLAPVVLPRAVADMRKWGFFPGSTIGNLDPGTARSFLRSARQVLGAGAWMIVGVDQCRDTARLLRAYDDAAGVTAAFNLNVLRRLNREAGGDFVLDDFVHRARWNAAEGRIEMHLESQRRHTVRVAGAAIHFEAGETIHTENSYKYSTEGFRSLAEAAGWSADHYWTDPDRLFAIHALRSPA